MVRRPLVLSQVLLDERHCVVFFIIEMPVDQSRQPGGCGVDPLGERRFGRCRPVGDKRFDAVDGIRDFGASSTIRWISVSRSRALALSLGQARSPSAAWWWCNAANVNRK
jgi:hypothetical protein